MDGSVTVRWRTLVTTGAALLALTAAYLLGGAGGGGPAHAAGPGPGPGTLTLSGRGEVRAVPDRLGFDVAVEVTRPDLSDALASASRTMRRVLGSLPAYGVERRDTRTTGLSMNPVYDYPSSGPPVLRGYHVSQRAAVLVRDLAQGGRAVSAVVAAGGNDVRVDGISLQVGDPEAALARARHAAVAEARAKAEQYAADTGQRLGAVLTLREVGHRGAGPVTVSAQSGTLDTRAAAAVPVRPGRADLAVTVQVVWEFGGPAR